MEKNKLLPHKERGKTVHVSFSLVWSLICRLWFKLRIRSHWGPEPTCSPYPFVHTGTQDNRKRLEPGVPWDPNLASSSSHFLYTPFFTYFFSLALFFSPFPPLNLCLPPIAHCKGIFCTALMERLLSNKGAHTVEQRQQIGSFVGSLKRLFHHGQIEREKGWERRRVWLRFIVTPCFQRKVRCVCLTEVRIGLRWPQGFNTGQLKLIRDVIAILFSLHLFSLTCVHVGGFLVWRGGYNSPNQSV